MLGSERERLRPADAAYVTDYQALKDPEAGTSSKPDEAQRFRRILKRSATSGACRTEGSTMRPAGSSKDKTNQEFDRMRRTIAARKERQRLKDLRGGQGHSFWYSLVSIHSHRTEAVLFRWLLAFVIVTDVICFVLETDANLNQRHALLFDTVEGVSSCLFLVEYLIRIITIPENKRYMNMPPNRARFAWFITFTSLIDLVFNSETCVPDSTS
eukprot:3223405-Amphidinium_carterae.1